MDATANTMKAILSYHVSCGPELLTLVNGVEILREDCWLLNLINQNDRNSIAFLGRDSLKRIEIEMNIGLFTELQHDSIFVSRAESLRRLRTTRHSILDYLMTSNINIIDNDLDAIDNEETRKNRAIAEIREYCSDTARIIFRSEPFPKHHLTSIRGNYCYWDHKANLDIVDVYII